MRRRRFISRSRLATTARLLLSMRASKKSSIGTNTETCQDQPSSRKPVSKYGNSLKKGFLNGIHTSSKTGKRESFESSYELRRFIALDNSPLVKSWGRAKLRIRYKVGKSRHKYHPDIFVIYNDGRIFLEEVKGFIWNKKVFLKKKFMAEWLCKQRGWEYRVIYQDKLETVE